jgi:hypothetical protein
VLRDVLGRCDARPSASTAARDATDPNRRLAAAVERYLDAHALHAATAGPGGESPATGGPLPWLPPPPDPDATSPDRGQLAEYVQRRADLVHALAAGITADHLPATAWADQLRRADPDLARRLAVWRAATGMGDHPRPLGPTASPEPPGRAELADQLRPHIAAGPPAPRPVRYEALSDPRQRRTFARSQQLAEQHRRLASHRDRQHAQRRGIHR